MRAHYLQHVAFEGLGSMENWLVSQGYQITSSRLFESEPLPDLDAIDLLIIMGGPMSVNDEAEFPWLVEEKRFVRLAVEAGVPVLGVCLGAQLIASAFGSAVYPNAEPEIGWFPLEAVTHSLADGFHFPPKAVVLHWHGETFDLPAGSTLLASSEGCRNQAFQLGEAVIGLQFHLEATPALLQGFISGAGDDLHPARYVQSAADILAEGELQFPALAPLMAGVLDYLHRRVLVRVQH